MTFADRLKAALKARRFEVLIDREEIYAVEDRKRTETLSPFCIPRLGPGFLTGAVPLVRGYEATCIIILNTPHPRKATHATFAATPHISAAAGHARQTNNITDHQARRRRACVWR